MSIGAGLINDVLNLIRGKQIRYIMEDGDMRLIRNLIDAVDHLDLVYDHVDMIYRERSEFDEEQYDLELEEENKE